LIDPARGDTVGLPEDLLEQARHLALRDATGRPRQDHLRRSVSTIYYAVFHFLIDQACRSLLGAARETRGLRGILARAFDHGSMRRVSASFASGNLSNRLAPGLEGHDIPPELRRVADTFRYLQERRHEADYDLLRRFGRSEVLLLIARADEALHAWANVAGSVPARLYLLALLAGERIRE